VVEGRLLVVRVKLERLNFVNVCVCVCAPATGPEQMVFLKVVSSVLNRVDAEDFFIITGLHREL